MISVFGEDRHLSCSPYLQPVVAAGVKCVVIDCRLEHIDSSAYSFLLAFARYIELMLRTDAANPCCDQSGEKSARKMRRLDWAPALLRHRVDGGVQAALVTCCFVLVHDLFVGNRIDHFAGIAQNAIGGGFVAAFDGCLHAFDRTAQF